MVDNRAERNDDADSSGTSVAVVKEEKASRVTKIFCLHRLMISEENCWPGVVGDEEQVCSCN